MKTGRMSMPRIITAKKAGYTLGLAFCIVGIALVVAVLSKILPEVWGSADPVKTFTDSLWVNYELFGFSIGKLVYYITAGVVLLVVGAVILIVRQEKIKVAEEVTVLLECPHCKNQWTENLSKSHLDSMGYPEVRTLSRRRCSKCGKFIRPRIMTTEK